MKSLFNGHCTGCNLLKPRCAKVVISTAVGTYRATLCSECRRGKYKGKFRLDERHK